jgi:hypothetical protein
MAKSVALGGSGSTYIGTIVDHCKAIRCIKMQ